MFKEYYDNNGYIVGTSAGEITSHSAEIDEGTFYQIKELLSNKPEKDGYVTHIERHEWDSPAGWVERRYFIEKIPEPELNDDELKRLLKDEILNAIPIDEKPTTYKEGFHLVPHFNGTAIVWEFEADPIPEPEEDVTLGTYTNPIPYENGMEVKVTKWYTDGSDIWECIQSGIPAGFTDTNYFDIIVI